MPVLQEPPPPPRCSNVSIWPPLSCIAVRSAQRSGASQSCSADPGKAKRGRSRSRRRGARPSDPPSRPCAFRASPLLIKRWGREAAARVLTPYKYSAGPEDQLGWLVGCLTPAQKNSRRRLLFLRHHHPGKSLRQRSPRAPLRSAKMPRVDADLKLDFKDVLLRPKRSSLRSRAEVGKISKGACFLFFLFSSPSFFLSFSPPL